MLYVEKILSGCEPGIQLFPVQQLAGDLRVGAARRLVEPGDNPILSPAVVRAGK
jgi:hypothetical protein